MTITAPSPWRALRATARGYAPRVFQGRGWAVAALVAAPVGLSLGIFAFGRLRADRESATDALALSRLRTTECAAYGETILKVLEDRLFVTFWIPVIIAC